MRSTPQARVQTPLARPRPPFFLRTIPPYGSYRHAPPLTQEAIGSLPLFPAHGLHWNGSHREAGGAGTLGSIVLQRLFRSRAAPRVRHEENFPEQTTPRRVPIYRGGGVPSWTSLQPRPLAYTCGSTPGFTPESSELRRSGTKRSRPSFVGLCRTNSVDYGRGR